MRPTKGAGFLANEGWGSTRFSGNLRKFPVRDSRFSGPFRRGRVGFGRPEDGKKQMEIWDAMQE
jgi:hypothetical protein